MCYTHLYVILHLGHFIFHSLLKTSYFTYLALNCLDCLFLILCFLSVSSLLKKDSLLFLILETDVLFLTLRFPEHL